MAERIAITLRMAPTTHAALKAAADNVGVPLTTYVREAAMMRAAYDHGLAAGVGHGAPVDPAAIEPIRQAVLQAVREWLD